MPLGLRNLYKKLSEYGGARGGGGVRGARAVGADRGGRRGRGARGGAGALRAARAAGAAARRRGARRAAAAPRRALRRRAAPPRHLPAEQLGSSPTVLEDSGVRVERERGRLVQRVVLVRARGPRLVERRGGGARPWGPPSRRRAVSPRARAAVRGGHVRPHGRASGL